MTICVNEIMGSVASTKDGDMDYLVWNMLSFLIKFHNSPLGLNPVTLESIVSIIDRSRYGLIGLNHAFFFGKMKFWTTWLEPCCFFRESEDMNYWIWTLLSFCRKIEVQDNMCQWTHKLINDRDIDYLIWIMFSF